MREREVVKAFGVGLWNIPAQFVFYILDLAGVVGVLVLVVDNWCETAIYVASMVVWIASSYLMFRAQYAQNTELKQRIAELEAIEADIWIRMMTESGMPKLTTSNGYIDDDRGVPVRAGVEAYLEFDNVGHEDGQPVLQVDQEASELPDGFVFHPDDQPGFNYALDWVRARETTHAIYVIPLQGTATSAVALAETLAHTDSYRIVVRYHTKRVGEDSPSRVFVVEGDLGALRKHLSGWWQSYYPEAAARLCDD